MWIFSPPLDDVEKSLHIKLENVSKHVSVPRAICSNIFLENDIL